MSPAPLAVLAALACAPRAAAHWIDGTGAVRTDVFLDVPAEEAPPAEAPGASGWRSPVLLAVAAYAVVYCALRSRSAAHSAERSKLDRLMCCWSDLYRGKACLAYNVAFAPAVLALHAVRIYLCACLNVYARRVFWRVCGCCANYFIDPEFPPESSSLGSVEGDLADEERGRREVIWVRAMDFGKVDVRQRTPHPHLHNTNMCLFEGGIEAKDVLRGAVGDCWLLAAVAALAEHEGAVRSLFLTPEVDPRGMYRLRLFDPQEQRWKIVVVDDFVPCEKDSQQPDRVRRGDSGMPAAQYAQPNGREIWAMVLEKAFAKLCGNYASIEAGVTEWGLMCMTGGSAWRYEATEAGDWQRSDLVVEAGAPDKRACAFVGSDERHDDGELFELLRYYHRRGAVLCCGGVETDGQSQGLAAKQVFSLLQVRTARTNLESEQYFRFVQVRNPWGTGEWTGPWSDEGPEWERFPHVKRELRFEKGDDGAFWMQWEDFCLYWSYIGCVDCTTDIRSLHSPYYVETDPAGPFKAMVLGCGQYWCMCSGIWHLFMTHEATPEQVSERELRATYGVDLAGPYCHICERETVCVDGKGGKLIPTAVAKAAQKTRIGSPEKDGSPKKDTNSGDLGGSKALLGGA